ncbi:hypothetical protein D9756_010103 [Leucocoprinus leucothites]|uniref:Uncharacterized protein n=1 Tax=Leucocoprinus leucothites TaxID=201217 RepID=A0A8H5CSY4_9AGAR|nr:hypothetical protein D9756_010103 [Leucoagaricus leucothites]
MMVPGARKRACDLVVFLPFDFEAPNEDMETPADITAIIMFTSSRDDNNHGIDVLLKRVSMVPRGDGKTGGGAGKGTDGPKDPPNNSVSKRPQGGGNKVCG